MNYEDDRDRERQKKHWRAPSDRDYAQAIYHMSPQLYGTYLQARHSSQEERHLVEAQMHQSLATAISDMSPEWALWLLEKSFGFGRFRVETADDGRGRAQAAAHMNTQHMALVRAILTNDQMPIREKAEVALRVSRIKPASAAGWGECRALVKDIGPCNYDFQGLLEAWCADMYRWFKRTSLGGMW